MPNDIYAIMPRLGSLLLACALFSAPALAQEDGKTAAALPELLPHAATYVLALDGSRPTAQLEQMHGTIDYRITGNACAGYDTLTRQVSESRGGESGVNAQAVSVTAHEDGAGTLYEFKSMVRDHVGVKNISARASRLEDGDVRVMVSEPQAQRYVIEGEPLLPSQHLRHVLAAGLKGQGHLAARVYDGATAPDKKYDTLAIIGKARQNAPSAKADGPQKGAVSALDGQRYYPVSISFYEPGMQDTPPAYVISYDLYESGVTGKLLIDYGRFALTGTLTRLEPLGAGEDFGTGEDCKKAGDKAGRGG